MKNHLGYYLSLFLILFAGFLIAFNSSDKQFQLEVSIMTAFFYAFWGILHHGLNHELTPKIVVEYILMASLGISMILFFLKGGFGL